MKEKNWINKVLDSEFVDVKENTLIQDMFCNKSEKSKRPIILEILLTDYSRITHNDKNNIKGKSQHIIRATNNYQQYGTGYRQFDHINVDKITTNRGKNRGGIIKPRIKKTKIEQKKRISEKAEVFTPAWVCNRQNNLIDEQWFGRKNIFNIESGNTRKVNEKPIIFLNKEGKTWQDYVCLNRLEISCGEAPYMVSRYDVFTGDILDVNCRIGFLDRKIRVINENVKDDDEWIKWVKIAFQSSYGYEWQGDSLLIARENIFYSFLDYYYNKFCKNPDLELMKEIARIISWNVRQMDGLTGLIPCTQKRVDDIFGGHMEFQDERIECIIKDWKLNKKITFNSLTKDN